jgi:mRNA interferase RelE/StbE
MRYRVEFLRSAQRAFNRLPRPVQERLEPRIAALADDPRPPGVVAMAGEAGALRLRIGDYRIVYRVQDETLTIQIVRVGHRREVYRE